MSIANELLTLNDTKLAIKEAIINKGVDVGEEDTFASYADRIAEIEGGGGGGGSGTKVDISRIDYSIGSNSTLKISDGRILQGFANMTSYHARPLDTSGNWLDVDWSKSFEIGIAFKYTVADTNQTLFGSGIGGAQYYKCPMIMLHPASQQFEIDISTTGNSWDMTMSQTVTYASLTINTWYFLKMIFNQSDMSLVIQISDDFSTWDTLLSITMSAAYYHDAASLCFGGFVQNSSFSSNNLLIDTFNTYIKDDSGEVIWGAYAGTFDDGKYPVVSGDYQLYDYIESDGTQLIDTGRAITAGDVVNTIFTAISGGSNGAYVWGKYVDPYYTALVIYPNNGFYRHYDNARVGDNPVDQTNFTVGKITEDSYTVATTLGGNYTLFDTASVKLYAFNINGDDYLPCKRKSDGVFGLYDVANKTFLTDSAGGNAFVGGNPIGVEV